MVDTTEAAEPEVSAEDQTTTTPSDEQAEPTIEDDTTIAESQAEEPTAEGP